METTRVEGHILLQCPRDRGPGGPPSCCFLFPPRLSPSSVLSAVSPTNNTPGESIGLPSTANRSTSPCRKRKHHTQRAGNTRVRTSLGGAAWDALMGPPSLRGLPSATGASCPKLRNRGQQARVPGGSCLLGAPAGDSPTRTRRKQHLDVRFHRHCESTGVEPRQPVSSWDRTAEHRGNAASLTDGR